MRKPLTGTFTLALILGFQSSVKLLAGVFVGPVVCDPTSGCQQGFTQTAPSQGITPFGITHPIGYTGAGGTIQVNICVEPSPLGNLEAATQWAVDLWNNLLPQTENCFACRTFEEGEPPLGYYSLASTVLHELGHGALGLDHPNRLWPDTAGDPVYDVTSFTLSYGDGAGGILAQGDGIRGSYDDTHVGPFGSIPKNPHWFRKADNNPVVVDFNTVVDWLTYSRSTLDLPPSHSWITNANRRVAQSLGHASTQSVMILGQPRNQFFQGLSADDVNTLLMARTGIDRVADTSDDYDVALTVVPCSDPHQVRLYFVPLGAGGILAATSLGVDYAYPQSPPTTA